LKLGEFELIDRLLKPLARGFPGALELEDDAALVPCAAGQEIVVAKDAIVAGVHYLPDDPADLVAGKLLRVNLSDLAAMGAEPVGYLTAFAVPRDLDQGYLAELVQGLARDQAAFGLHLLGGDTVTTSGPLVLTLTILGRVEAGTALRRSGARPGDLVMVSGTLGDAALGLRVLRGLAATEDETWFVVDRYRTPRPRLALGTRLRGMATAAIDVSDGLLADLGHILDASGVGAEIEAARLPLSTEALGLPRAVEAALSGGDDYELLFTLPPAELERCLVRAAEANVPVTVIGSITAEKGLVVRDASGAPMPTETLGWQHF
jgi:thiamine-monophosphate kinase